MIGLWVSVVIVSIIALLGAYLMYYAFRSDEDKKCKDCGNRLELSYDQKHYKCRRCGYIKNINKKV